jgi:hypothetical protein
VGAAVFEKQVQHLTLLILLLAVVGWVSELLGIGGGSFQGISTPVWFWWSIAFPVLHQVWVVVCWRLELHQRWLSQHLGEWGFRIYAAGFALFSAGRIYTMIAVSIADQGSVQWDQRILNGLALLVAVPAIYLFYSVSRFFGYKRALGVDHFDPEYRTKPFVRQGIFRFTRNGMYTFGMAAFWIPGLVWASKAGLLSAAFTHLFIWVHYFCTELPDMRWIYGADRT